MAAPSWLQQTDDGGMEDEEEKRMDLVVSEPVVWYGGNDASDEQAAPDGKAPLADGDDQQSWRPLFAEDDDIERDAAQDRRAFTEELKKTLAALSASFKGMLAAMPRHEDTRIAEDKIRRCLAQKAAVSACVNYAAKCIESKQTGARRGEPLIFIPTAAAFAVQHAVRAIGSQQRQSRALTWQNVATMIAAVSATACDYLVREIRGADALGPSRDGRLENKTYPIDPFLCVDNVIRCFVTGNAHPFDARRMSSFSLYPSGIAAEFLRPSAKTSSTLSVAKLASCAVASALTTPEKHNEATKLVIPGQLNPYRNHRSEGIFGSAASEEAFKHLGAIVDGVENIDQPTQEDIVAAKATLEAAQNHWPHFFLRASATSPFGGFLQSQLWDICNLRDAYDSLGLQSRACEQLRDIAALDQECRDAIRQLVNLLDSAVDNSQTRRAVAAAIRSKPALVDTRRTASTPPGLQGWLDACARAFADGKADLDRVAFIPERIQVEDSRVYSILKRIADEAEKCNFSVHR